MDTERTDPESTTAPGDAPGATTAAEQAAEQAASLYPKDPRVPGNEAADPATSKELGNGAPAVGPKSA